MYFVYILSSNTGKHYIGFTSNLEQRVSQHNRKHHGFTNQNYTTWTIEISKQFDSKSEAMILERRLKSFKNYRLALEYLRKL